MKPAMLAGLLAIAAVPATAQAAPPQLLSPPDGAVFSIDSTIEFVAQAPRFRSPTLVIAVRPDLNPEGYLALAFTIDSALMQEADASGDALQAPSAAIRYRLEQAGLPSGHVLLASLRALSSPGRVLAPPLIHASAIHRAADRVWACA